MAVRNALNEVLRDGYVEDNERGVRKWNKALEAGGVTVGDDVQLTVELELNDSPQAARKEAQAETKPQNR